MFKRSPKTWRSIMGNPSADPGYCQKAAQQSEEMPSDFGDENLYCLISRPQDQISHSPRYLSKVCPEHCIHVHLMVRLSAFNERAIVLQFAERLDNKELCFGRREHKKFATMGLAKGIVTSRPKDFLRKNAGHAEAQQGLHTLLSSIWDIQHQ